jgi:hypothetical protein
MDFPHPNPYVPPRINNRYINSLNRRVGGGGEVGRPWPARRLSVSWMLHSTHVWQRLGTLWVAVWKLRTDSHDNFILWMRSSRMVRTSDSQCQSRNYLGFNPSILRHSGILWAADEAVLNNVLRLVYFLFQWTMNQKISSCGFVIKLSKMPWPKFISCGTSNIGSI